MLRSLCYYGCCLLLVTACEPSPSASGGDHARVAPPAPIVESGPVRQPQRIIPFINSEQYYDDPDTLSVDPAEHADLIAVVESLPGTDRGGWDWSPADRKDWATFLRQQHYLVAGTGTFTTTAISPTYLATMQIDGTWRLSMFALREGAANFPGLSGATHLVVTEDSYEADNLFTCYLYNGVELAPTRAVDVRNMLELHLYPQKAAEACYEDNSWWLSQNDYDLSEPDRIKVDASWALTERKDCLLGTHIVFRWTGDGFVAEEPTWEE